jgi:uncharacterized protein (TIGR02266 family)
MSEPQRDRFAAAALKVKYKCATIAEFIRQSSKDISLLGIFIKTKSPMKEGVPLKLELHLEDGSPVIRGVGQVVWSREVAQSDDRPSGMGIKFLKLDTSSRQVIEQAVKARGSAPSRFDRLGEAAARATNESGRLIIHQPAYTPLGTRAAGVFSSVKPPQPTPEPHLSTGGWAKAETNLPKSSFRSDSSPAPELNMEQPTSAPSGERSEPVEQDSLHEPSPSNSIAAAPVISPLPSNEPITAVTQSPAEADLQAATFDERIRALENELFGDLNETFGRLNTPIPPAGPLSELMPTVKPPAMYGDLPVSNPTIPAPPLEHSRQDAQFPLPEFTGNDNSRLAIADEQPVSQPPPTEEGREPEQAVDPDDSHDSASEKETAPRENPVAQPQPQAQPSFIQFSPKYDPERPFATTIRTSNVPPPVPISRLTPDPNIGPTSPVSSAPRSGPPVEIFPVVAVASAPPRDMVIPRSPLLIDAGAPIAISRSRPRRAIVYTVTALIVGAAILLSVFVIRSGGGLKTATTREVHTAPSAPTRASAPTPAATKAGTLPARANSVAGPGANPKETAPVTSDIFVSSIPDKAAILVAGAIAGRTPGKLVLPIGEKVTVEVKAPGFAAASQAIIVQPNHPPLSFSLSALPYQLTVESDPLGANVITRGLSYTAPAVIELGQVNAPFFVIVAKNGYKKQVTEIKPEHFAEKDGLMRAQLKASLIAVVKTESRAPSTSSPSSGSVPPAPRRPVVLLKEDPPSRPTPTPESVESSKTPARSEMAPNPYGNGSKPAKKSRKTDLPDNPF